MKSSANSLPFIPDVADIRRLSLQITEPKDYFNGVGDLSGSLPGNILCFARRHASELRGTPGAYLSRPAAQHHRCVLLIAVQGDGQLCLDADSFAIN